MVTAPMFDPQFIVAAVSATLQGIQTWITIRDRRRTAEVFLRILWVYKRVTFFRSQGVEFESWIQNMSDLDISNFYSFN